MNAKILVTGVAVAVLAAGFAAAQTTPSASTAAAPAPAASSDMGAKAPAHHHAHHNRMAKNERRGAGGRYAAPEQPIPYAMLDQYMKASPKERTAMLQQANTGNTADVSATAPAASPSSNMGAAGADNPSASTPPQSSMGSSSGTGSMSGSTAAPAPMAPAAPPEAAPNTPPPSPPQ